MPRFHFYSKAEMIGPRGDIHKIRIFCAIGISVLLIACINYMNLATARFCKRAREIGVYKVIGATKGKLMRQFLTESVLLTYLALLLAIILSNALLSEFNRMVGRHLSWEIFNNGILLVGVLTITTLVGIISGSYPAFFLSSLKPTHVFRQAVPVKKGAGEQEHIWINTNDVDKHFLNTYGIKLVQGRNFTDEDVQVYWRCILNETAVKRFGWDVNEAVGKRVGQDFRVIGIVKDFHFKSLREKIGPLVLTPFRPRSNTRDRYQLSVKLDSGTIEEALKFIGSKFETFFPNDIFEYKFFDENLDWIYSNETKKNEAFSYFSILTIFIACLGLFGLASFTAEQRTKEIGIRKVCGASITNIVLLLSSEYLKWILLANIIAWPIAHYAIHEWLQGFAYRTRMDVGIFAFSSILALIIALLTVSYQTIKAARTNPTNSLKWE